MLFSYICSYIPSSLSKLPSAAATRARILSVSSTALTICSLNKKETKNYGIVRFNFFQCEKKITQKLQMSQKEKDNEKWIISVIFTDVKILKKKMKLTKIWQKIEPSRARANMQLSILNDITSLITVNVKWLRLYSPLWRCWIIYHFSSSNKTTTAIFQASWQYSPSYEHEQFVLHTVDN